MKVLFNDDNLICAAGVYHITVFKNRLPFYINIKVFKSESVLTNICFAFYKSSSNTAYKPLKITHKMKSLKALQSLQEKQSLPLF